MDITLQIKRGCPGAVEERGDIIDAWLTDGRRVNVDKFFYVYITGVPDVSLAKLRRIRDFLTEPDLEDVGIDPETGAMEQRLRNSRKWHIPRGALPKNARRALARDGTLTVTWAQAKPYIRRKLVQMLRDDDPDNPTFDAAQTVELTDQDMADA